MKKISTAILATTFALLSATAFACPKGTEMQGGTGPHHKGGKCVAVSSKKTAAKPMMSTEKTKSMHSTAPTKTDTKTKP